MPWKPKHPCAWPLCPALTDKQYCPEHQKMASGEYKRDAKERGVDRDYYSSRRWRRLRKMFLAAHPICVTPGCNKPATEVDHIIPRDKGGTDEESNLQAMCKPCHSRKSVKDGRWG